MKRFQEYLDSRGKIDKPKVKVVADDVDLPAGRDKKPPKGMGMKNDQQPYVNDKGKISRSKQKAFGEQGEQDLVYDVTKETKPAKIPTAEAVSLFARSREAIQSDPTLLEYLVRDLKKNGLLAAMVGEIACHKESFNALAQLMADKNHGPDVCRKLARALTNEDVSPPFGEDDPNADAMDGNGLSGDADGMKDDDDSNVDPDDEDPTQDVDDDNFIDDGDDDDQDPDAVDNTQGDEDNPLGNPQDPRSKPMQPMPTPAMEHFSQALGRYLKG